MTDPAPASPSVSIIGIGCRMPGVAGVPRFWDLLLTGATAGLEHTFDHEWFGIDAATAARLDPRERLSLTVAVEAVDDAGIGYRARGSPAAVFFGASGSNMIANRVSRALDLRGPSLVLDSAGTSSLAAVDLAVRLLADGTAPWALVGGVDAADADGRGGGCTVLVLQRTADARREGNRVYAEILGTAVGSDGRLTDGRTRRRVIRAAWERAGLDPHAAGYFECHGSPAASVDAAEIDALARVLHSGSPPSAKIWVGSVTADPAPLVAAAGVTGLAKAALCVERGIIVPARGFRDDDAAARLGERGLRVPSEPIGWQEVPASDRIAGVGSVGIGGTTAHAVLRGVARPPAHRDAGPPTLIPLSAATPERLRELAGRWADLLLADHPPLSEFASAAGRLLPEPVRAVVLADKHAEAAARLRALARGQTAGSVRPERHPGGVLFLFGEWTAGPPRAGRALAARYPVFARAVADAADAVVRAGGERVWTPKHGFDDGPVARFVFQVALAELVRAWGIRPDAVAGYGPGEIAAAVTAGAVTLDDGARLALARAAVERVTTGVVVLETTPYEAERLIEPLRGEVRIEAVLGPDTVVLTGAARRLDAVVRKARRRGVPVRSVDTATSFAGTPEFDALTPSVPEVPLYSTTRRGTVITTAQLDAAYWAENARATVHLAAALESAAAHGVSTVLELAAAPELAPVVREYPDFRESTHELCGPDEATAFRTAIGRLYLEGREVNWSAHGSFARRPPERRWRPTPPVTAPARVTTAATEAARGYDPTVATALEWAATVLRTETWIPIAPATGERPEVRGALVIGESALAVALARMLDRRLPTRRVARATAGALAALREPTAAVVVWSGPDDTPAAAAARAADLLRAVRDSPAVTALTVVLRDRAALTQHAVAGMVRAMQPDAAPPTRLVWSAGDDARAVAHALANHDAGEELSVDGPTVTARRFRPVGPPARPRAVSTAGTYVVTGGLGTLGAVATRWLLHAGARDVVVLTRTPRPLPPVLAGLEERIVVARCDVTDRDDLAAALDDIRACGSEIRGLVHAAGAGAGLENGSARGLERVFAASVSAAQDLLELTAADAIDFALLFGIAADTLGGPGSGPRAAVAAALDAVARARHDQRATAIAWGAWESDRPAGELRRAGLTPFDAARATAVLMRILEHRETSVLAVDHRPAPNHVPANRRLTTLFGP
ncbi:SDR family NAD(P)-dependent oxidoreductase [Nocardia sp. NPDC004068]|uniref:SDR family NAD(P)-dependent oxidoreductase n=1 Tax=Nocardia sp. NPDC004068 TaxID=3364303 RepID=UPI0036759E89